MTAAGTAVAVVLLLGAVAVHKAGHAAAYRDSGAGVTIVRWGLPLPPRWTRPPGAKPWVTVVSPWLVTGHVTPAVPPGDAVTLGYPAAALYSAGGVLASFASGSMVLAVWCFLTGRLVPMLALGTAAGLLWGQRNRCAAVLVPAFPVVLLGSEMLALTGGMHLASTGAGGVLAVHTFLSALFAAGVFSLSVGMFAMLPFPSFDGGLMLAVGLGFWRRETPASIYEAARSCVLIAVIMVAVLVDVLGIVG